jgi:2-isopropylmalate synthase
MEHIDGALVGNERRILLSELAGKSTIVRKLERYGDFDKSSTEVARILAELSNYHLEAYQTGATPSKTVGRIFVRVDGNLLMGAAVGVGPVDTLNMAIRDALVPIYPFLLKIKLTDYRVRVLNPE